MGASREFLTFYDLGCMGQTPTDLRKIIISGLLAYLFGRPTLE